jgi:hypothetical protein
MKVGLIARVAWVARLERLEAQWPEEKHWQVQIGYLKRLAADYQGERHVVTVGQQTADGRVPVGMSSKSGPDAHQSNPCRIRSSGVCLVKAAWREGPTDRAHEQVFHAPPLTDA